MLLFSTCKPFVGHDGLIQRNALRSWARLPRTRVYLIGDEPGTQEMAKEIGAAWWHYPAGQAPHVETLWNIAASVAEPEEVLCYANADLILLPQLVEAAEAAAAWQKQFLLVGQRYSIQVYEELDFTGDWQQELAAWYKGEGSLGVECMVDYFCYRDVPWAPIPDFRIGRYQWDDWLLWRALSQNVFTADVTSQVPVYHQGHHQLAWEHPEARENRRLAQGNPGAGIKDVRWIWTQEGFKQR